MKTALHTAFLFVTFSCITFPAFLSGQNILTNGDFETFTTCPTLAGQISYATPHDNIVGHSGSPDFFNSCAVGIVGVPSNTPGFQAARGGNGYIGLTLIRPSFPNFREYVCTPFTTPMTIGVTYRLEFYASLADNVQNSTDDFQFYFSNACPVWGGSSAPMTTLTPQATLPTGSYINDKTNWVYYTVDVVATSSWTRMTMGNFLDDASSSIVNVGSGAVDPAYIYMDDWSVSPVTVMDADMSGPFATEEEGVDLNWSTTREEGTRNWVVQRSIGDASHFEVIATLDAAGNSTDSRTYAFTDAQPVRMKENFYRIALIDADGKLTYSKTVSVTPGKEEQWLSISGANPVETGFFLETTVNATEATDVIAQIVDLSGRILSEQVFHAEKGPNQISVSTEGISAGSYLLVEKMNTLRESKHFLVMNDGI